MKNNVKVLSRSAILAAAAVVILCLASAFPSGKIALVAIAGLTGVLAVIHCGGKWAAGVYLVSGLLGLLLAPNKSSALLYLLFLGYYPALKSPIEHIRSRTGEWAVKFALFNAAFVIVYFLLRQILLDGMRIPASAWLLWLGGNAVFFVYDIGLSRLIEVYVRNYSAKMKK